MNIQKGTDKLNRFKRQCSDETKNIYVQTSPLSIRNNSICRMVILSVQSMCIDMNVNLSISATGKAEYPITVMPVSVFLVPVPFV